jgi:ATP-dependent Clp protease ATP-binding subunit ClpC
MDDGILTDNKGQKVTFKDTVIIMTSNVGVEDFKKIETAIGFNHQQKDLSHGSKTLETRKSLEKVFPPEFLNRVDEIVTFHALNKEECLDIVQIMLQEVIDRLRDNQRMTMNAPTKVREFLVNEGFNQKFGARPLKQAIKRYVENPLAEMILRKEFSSGDQIVASVANRQVEVDVGRDGLEEKDRIKKKISEDYILFKTKSKKPSPTGSKKTATKKKPKKSK